jgi:2-polyprenyl-6-methoxyphenol hydroxylase-like FAD-dependent oxidoreductase
LEFDMSRVLVVGAGPGGATLAYLLARRGIDVVLFERQRDFAREFRGEVLFPSGLEPFRQMGLWNELNAVPHVELGAVELYVNGAKLVRAAFDAVTFGELAPRWTSQPALLEMLIEQTQRFPNFRFERGTAVRGLIMDNGRVVGVTLSHGSEERGDLVVGADGRTSIVRRRSEVEVREDATPMDIVWCKLPLPDYLRSDPHIRGYVGNGHLLISAPVYDGRLQMAWIIAKGSYGELRERGMPACLDEMAAHVSPDLAAHLRRHREDAVQPFLLSTVSDRVRRWSRPGMLLIGDAAHTMSPVGAQGLNIAIRDAIVGANHLIPTFEADGSPPAVDAACRRIERERLREVAQIQRLQALPPRIILRDSWWSRLALSAAARLLGSDIARARGGVAFRRFAFGVTEVELSV